jgi:hypothetical protein
MELAEKFSQAIQFFAPIINTGSTQHVLFDLRYVGSQGKALIPATFPEDLHPENYNQTIALPPHQFQNYVLLQSGIAVPRQFAQAANLQGMPYIPQTRINCIVPYSKN